MLSVHQIVVLTAKVLAESPSVKMSVQSAEYRPPASLASSSFWMPTRRVLLAPSVFLRSFWSLAEATDRAAWTTSELTTAVKWVSYMG